MTQINDNIGSVCIINNNIYSHNVIIYTGYFTGGGGASIQLYSICIFIYKEIPKSGPFYSVKIVKWEFFLIA